ncbi:hypothetical protein AGLY_014673, partial [Aphis glycines]
TTKKRFFENYWKILTFDLYNAPKIFNIPSETALKYSTNNTHPLINIGNQLTTIYFLPGICNIIKAGKWVLLCCTLGTVWITIVYYRSVKFESNDSLTYEKYYIKFSTLSNLCKFFMNYTYNIICKYSYFGEFFRKLVLRKNFRFSVIFFLFFSIFLKTVGKCLLSTSSMHQGNSLCHRKPPPKFEIEALFRLVMLYTDTKKTHTHIINLKIEILASVK